MTLGGVLHPISRFCRLVLMPVEVLCTHQPGLYGEDARASLIKRFTQRALTAERKGDALPYSSARRPLHLMQLQVHFVGLSCGSRQVGQLKHAFSTQSGRSRHGICIPLLEIPP